MVASAQDGTAQDVNTVKALFLYNFTKHIEWPVQKLSEPRFNIIVFGKSPVTSRLSDLLKGRKILDKNVEIKETSNIDEVNNVYILFITKGNTDKLPLLIEKFSGKSVLIITEEKKMPAKGVHINIFEKDNHLRFELNDIVIKRDGLKVSNQLYELANVAR
jgi:hypothetical protein